MREELNGKRKVLILNCVGYDWTNQHFNEMPNVSAFSIYRKEKLLMRILRRMHFLSPLPKKNIWYGEWKKIFKKYDCIIVFSSLFGTEIFEWIRKQGYCGRVICYYRDPQSASYMRKCVKATSMMDKNNVDLWTFDFKDACEFSMKYNPQFYFSETKKECLKECLYDAIYIGASKGRADLIISTYKKLKDAGVDARFIVKIESNIKRVDGVEYVKRNIGYERIIDFNRDSKAIVELNRFGQTGLTLRALEALFMKKKLITNNHSIINEDFYNENNVFIIGRDNFDDLKKWLEIPLEEIPMEVKYKYTAEAWLNRFFE